MFEVIAGVLPRKRCGGPGDEKRCWVEKVCFEPPPPKATIYAMNKYEQDIRDMVKSIIID